MICNSYIEFKSNDIIGNISEPFVFAFDSYIHNVNIDMIPEMAAIITGSGEYKKYDTCTLQITTYPGYDFLMLQEGTTTVNLHIVSRCCRTDISLLYLRLKNIR